MSSAPGRPAAARSPYRRWPGRRRRFARAGCETLHRDLAEAPVAPLVVEDRFEQLAPRDVRPQERRDVQLRVGELPQQKVRQATLARGADEEVGITARRRIEPLPDRLFVDLLEAPRPLEDLLR